MPNQTFTKTNAFTCAFNTIARACIPHMDHKYGFFSDFIYDAERAVALTATGTLFLVVRDCGTTSYDDLRSALAECDNYSGRVLVAIQRGDYDDFTTCVMRTA
jgi:hypothetical protein